MFDAAELDQYLVKNPQLFPASEGYAAGLRMVAPEQVPEACDALVRLGYSDADLELILQEEDPVAILRRLSDVGLGPSIHPVLTLDRPQLELLGERILSLGS